MKRNPTIFEAFSPIVVVLLLTSIGFAILKLPIHTLLIIASIYSYFIARRVGLDWDDIMEGITKKISAAMPALLILIAIGILIGTWTASGMIPAVIYFGLDIIKPELFLIIAFIATAIVSIITGSSWSSAGTIGVAFMGMATALDISLPIAAGAIISGAYFGDKLSPLSDTTNLAPLITGVNIFEHIKHMLYTTIPASVIALVVFFIAGLQYDVSETTAVFDATKDIKESLNNMYNWSWWLLIPGIIILYGSIRKKPVLPVIILSCVIASFIAVFTQGISYQDIFAVTLNGFSVDMLNLKDSLNISEDVSKLLERGGMNSMTNVVLVSLCALTFAGIISAANCLEVIVNTFLKLVRRVGDLILITVISTMTTALVTANTYLPIIIPGELYKDTYLKYNLHPKNLSRTLEDSGTVIIPLVPWSTSGIFMAETLGVPTLQYLPWAVLCYTGFIIAIVLGYSGIGITKLSDVYDESK
ncbi:Na+/H+ antiporter NhaC [Phocicoccus pinnipedialis]|uniref:Malate-2H(+)/Na(+)-lactate antiporter n=1 Tax=Phocicoccus pinnipedialis TaxID=110845 RepID=A0A6V7RNL1_9BACL|nr:Na+/H+ antiporter NhaC [Jeotgalicoccus pinnipedialis]MBP1938822.1 NhaC family Na+:H+ antiporter [Jeotgalicoccus pinnipedialis]CAD2079297.1 Malate-2H(+)/Na(+)-lactate antiporter [Jeotgalicoccus pinnipedialis]